MRLAGFLVFIGIFIAVLIGYPIVNSGYFDNQGLSIESPLPHFLTKIFPNFLGDSNFWKPNDKVMVSKEKEPTIIATSAISYDLTTNQLLYQKNPKKRLPIASLTKIMTAIVGLKSGDVGKELVVSPEAASVGENSMGASEGETYTLEDLL